MRKMKLTFAELVGRTVRIIREVNKAAVSSDEARAILGLAKN
ncbi:hypothetical protein [Anaerospora hongkongensis]|nr:hypothetical protein [Anaerospora hongkongensis]